MSTGFVGWPKASTAPLRCNLLKASTAVVRRMYDAVLAGKNLGELCDALTVDAVPTPNGNSTWTAGVVGAMLRSEVYRGNYRYQKFYAKDVLEKKTARNKGQLPQYFIEDHHEAIVPSDDWERVQVLLQHRSELRDQRERKKHPAHTGKNAAFEGFFRCGECDSIIGHRGCFTGEREMNGWVCIDAARAYAIYSLVEEERQQAERNVPAIDVVTGRMVQLQE